jgi:NAD(P)H-dependent FMN reductase
VKVIAVRILAISGSLRAHSGNSILVRALVRLAPDGVEVVVWDGLARLPHFNPDDDGEGAVPPPAVAELRDAVAAANALAISSPEYAHGVPGSLKNALDWLVSSPVVIDKPVAVINASPHSRFAHAQLIETLATMSARVIADASITIAVPRRPGLDEAALAADPAVAAPLRAALATLAAA